jgi:peptide/nickel transport system substrate-binding protein
MLRNTENPAGWRKAAHAAMLSVGLLAATTVGATAQQALTVAQAQDPGNLDPIDTFLLSWGSIGSNIFDGLVVRTEELVLEPALATSWDFSADNKRIRFNLREGVTFHNGEPFNAAAVKFTFDRLLGEEGAKGPQQSNYVSIENVEIVDDLTVDFVMKSADPVMLTKLSGYGAMIVPPAYLAEVGADAFDKKPVGTGPFKVVEYTPSQSVKLDANEAYWRGAPKLDTLTYRFISEPSTRIAELQSGGVDLAMNIPASSIDVLNGDDNVDLVSVPGPTVFFLRLKIADGPTSDVRVRQAINLAIDRQAIIDGLLGGEGTPISSLQGTKSFGYDADLKGYDFDPEAAKALLAEAGHASGLEMTMDVRSDDATFKEVAQAITGYLGAVGIKVKLQLHESGVYWSEIVPKGQTGDMYAFAWGGWTFDFDNTAYLLYHSGEFWNPYIEDATLDALLEKQRQSYDADLRQKTLSDVARYSHENALEVPLYNTATMYGVRKNVQGFVAAPDDRTRFANVTVN